MVKVLLVFILVAILMEDESSIRKTEEERKEDEDLAKAVNRTLAEEEKKRKEEEDEKKEEDERKKRDEKKKTTGKVKDIKEKRTDTEKQVGQDEDCPSCNFTCPVVTPCQPCRKCQESVDCDPCIPKDCRPCPRCEELEECPPLVCPPVLPCPADNSTLRGQELPSPPSCPELPSMTVPVALATGATVSLLAVSAAAVLGLVLRYVPPLISGFLFLFLILMVWFLSSRYPEVAREMGARAWTMMQEATTALSHRIMEALRHHNEQVCFSLLLTFQFEFHVLFEKVCTKIFYVEENSMFRRSC
jgi:hypothetical protein